MTTSVFMFIEAALSEHAIKFRNNALANEGLQRASTSDPTAKQIQN